MELSVGLVSHMSYIKSCCITCIYLHKDTEHRQLLKVIKDRQAGVGKASNGAQESVIVLKAQVALYHQRYR